MPRPPPTADELVEVFRATTDKGFSEPILEDPEGSGALIRAFAEQWAALATKIARTFQAKFYLSHALQIDLPASSGAKATFTTVLKRTGDVSLNILAQPGAIRITAIGGRIYESVNAVEWLPFEIDATRTVAFQCAIDGFIGNLDHVADDSGDVDVEQILAIADQDQGRADEGASIVQIGGRRFIQDTGAPDVFGPDDIGLYVRIDVAANPANQGRVLRIDDFVWDGVEFPIGSGAQPGRAMVNDIEVRNKLQSAKQDDGGVFTDFTAAADNDTVDDVDLLPAGPAIGDTFYFGAENPFPRLAINVSTPGVGVWTLVYEYWNGTAFTAIEVNDQTNGFRGSAGINQIFFDRPEDWATTAVDGVTVFWLRARVSAFTSITTQPKAARAWIFEHVPLATAGESGTIKWTLLDWESLGLEIVSATAATGGRDDDLFLLGDDRGVFQQENEPDDAFRERAARLTDMVSFNAIQRLVNRQLNPFALKGQVLDVGKSLTGFFWDEDAYDYYEPGDVFPEDPWKLYLDGSAAAPGDAYGWFIVLVPFLGQGDFGVFYDEGPTLFLDDRDLYIGPAWDAGFYNGEPVDGYAAYRGIYNAIRQIKMGGIGFTILRDASLNP